MKSLDTNIILRFLLKDVPHQWPKAVAVINGSNCYVTDVVITETVFVLEKVYLAPRKRIAGSLKPFLSFPNLESNYSLLSDMLDLYEKHGDLSIIDCYLAVEAEAGGNQLVSFDQKLLKHGGEHVIEA